MRRDLGHWLRRDKRRSIITTAMPRPKIKVTCPRRRAQNHTPARRSAARIRPPATAADRASCTYSLLTWSTRSFRLIEWHKKNPGRSRGSSSSFGSAVRCAGHPTTIRTANIRDDEHSGNRPLWGNCPEAPAGAPTRGFSHCHSHPDAGCKCRCNARPIWRFEIDLHDGR